jgi:hypothetical protein
LSVVCDVCCQIEVSEASWSLVQLSPTDCGASLCVIKKPRVRGGHNPRWAAVPEKIIMNNIYIITICTYINGARGGAVVEVSLEFFIGIILPAALCMALGSTQPLT